MITIDIPAPATCYRCPCVTVIKYGPFAGRDMCGVRITRGEPVISCLVDLDNKPDWCPIREIPAANEKNGRIKNVID